MRQAWCPNLPALLLFGRGDRVQSWEMLEEKKSFYHNVVLLIHFMLPVACMKLDAQGKQLHPLWEAVWMSIRPKDATEYNCCPQQFVGMQSSCGWAGAAPWGWGLCPFCGAVPGQTEQSNSSEGNRTLEVIRSKWWKMRCDRLWKWGLLLPCPGVCVGRVALW